MERWPVFNVADIAVTIGMIILITLVLSDRGHEHETSTEKEIKKNGGFALRAAASGGHIDIVKYLLERGVDPTKSGKPSALDVATRKGHWEIVSLLKSYGAKK